MKTKLKVSVEEVLEEDERSRNDDNWLIFQVLREKYGINLFIDYKQFPLPVSIESIIRTRARIQNEEKKFLPTDEEINKKRMSIIPEQEGVTFIKPEILKEQ